MNQHDRSDVIRTAPANEETSTERERRSVRGSELRNVSRSVDRSEELERHLQEAIDMATD